MIWRGGLQPVALLLSGLPSRYSPAVAATEHRASDRDPGLRAVDRLDLVSLVPEATHLLQRGQRAFVRVDHHGDNILLTAAPSPGGELQEPNCDEPSQPCFERSEARGHQNADIGSAAKAEANAFAGTTASTSAPSSSTGASVNGSAYTSKVGINLSVKWMARPLPAQRAVELISRIQVHLGLSQPIQRVKTFDLSPSNVDIINLVASGFSNVKELVIGIGNLELDSLPIAWLQGIKNRFGGALHIAVGNEPDRDGVSGSQVVNALRLVKRSMPDVKVTVPFAYSIMGRSHPVNEAKFSHEFLAEFNEVLTLVDYISINIYPFLSAGVRNVALDNLTGPSMPFLGEQLAALKVALDRTLPQNRIPIAIGETGWPSCGAARWRPYSFAALPNSEEYMRNVARWIESEASSGKITSGYLFTAFDEETKGTRAIERHYGVLDSDGSFKRPESCTSNSTEDAVAWLENDYPDCESDLDWMVRNFENAGLMEKFTNRGLDGSLCSFQQYLSDRWASCPPVARIPGSQAFFGQGHMAYGSATAKTKCNSSRLSFKYADRGPTMGPAAYLPPSATFRGLLPRQEGNRTLQHALHADLKRPNETGARLLFGSPEQAVAADEAITELQVFWINLDASLDRRRSMEASLEELSNASFSDASVLLRATRVPAVTPEDVHTMVLNSTLRVQASLIDACTLACPLHHQRGELLTTEMAVTLSHLRAVDQAYNGGAELALILEDDVHIYGELLSDLRPMLQAAPSGWSALQMSTVSSKALLQLFSSSREFHPREERFYGMGAYFINRYGMEHLLAVHATHDFRRPLSETSLHAGSLQAEGLLFGTLPAGTVHTSTRFYFRFLEFPTTVHKMAEDSQVYAVNSIKWQADFIDRHRGLSKMREPQSIDEVASRLPTGTVAQSGRPLPSFLAMTTLVCRRNPSFHGEVDSIVKSMNALQAYRFNWTVFAVIQDKPKSRACPGLHKFAEFQRPEVRLEYRQSTGRFSKWIYYTEDIDTIDRFDFYIVFDADMGLSTFPWQDFFGRYQMYAARWSAAPVAGVVRNSTPFWPLRTEWWEDCGRAGVRFVEVDFVEQWFAMLSGHFAAWFLRRVVASGLISNQKELGVDWGVDAAWCGAAAEWSGKEVGCLLIPMDMYHGDTKSLKQDVVFHKRGEHLNNLWWLRLPLWMKASEVWLGSFFQDPGMTCSPCGLEERYHISQDLRRLVPIVPTGGPGASMHLQAEDSDEASASAYARKSSARGHTRLSCAVAAAATALLVATACLFL